VGIVVGDAEVGMDVGDFAGIAEGLEDIGLSVVGILEGAIVGAAVGEDEGDLVGL
jgi:hypothetical protein